MPLEEEKIIEIIYSSIDEINETLPPEERVSKLIDLEIYGSNSLLDSLSFVGLIVSIEEKIFSLIGLEIDIADLIEREDIEFETVTSLIELIQKNS